MKFKKSKIYLILLCFTYFRDILDILWGQYSSYLTLMGYLLIAAIFVLYCINTNRLYLNRVDFFCLTAFVLGQCMGYAYSYTTSYPNNNIERAIIWIFSYFIFVIFPRKVIITKKEMEQLLKIIIAVALFSAIYAVVFQLNGEAFSFRGNSNFNMSNSYRSIWGHRNQFGVILLGGIIATWYFMHQVKKKGKLRLLILFLTVNLAFTFSRTCYVAFLAYIFGYMLCEWKIHKKAVIALIFLVLLCFVLYLFVPLVTDFADKYMIRESSGLTGRDTLWQVAFDLLDTITLWFGRGMGIDRVVLAEDTVGAGVGFHSMYITYLLSGGIILSAVVVVVIGRNLYLIWNKLSKISRPVFDWAVGSIIAFLVYPVFEVSAFFVLTSPSLIQTFYVLTIPLLLSGNAQLFKGETAYETRLLNHSP
ncbi:hypothetical protein acsn021_43040 [Anaerocolumna cellulosilytica]|uniref:O-antigen ligase-related domain-containing protein n=1 Tax=Anaerocolumna cellulosilytica TaxID=433286 RepID=A0A6S6RCM0_9FIRM|nr:O-antigen ligase family protein [Anaerocolumna cellulosilytica]MBB5195262.1 hypothetical protein [Anaerocolumna cellulosilytica]BCJ96735.1 hypothetical protein acsn021_43040 [Anaerocolumna cellulosilytica]